MTITNRVSLKSVMAGVTPIADVPDAPTVSAANVGTSRAYNNGAATVTVTAAATGGTPATFTATSTPGSFTATGTSPLTVTGLQSATSYTFAVTGTNTTATGPAGTSSSITATTVPQTPTISSATRSSNTEVAIAFSGATGGASLSSVTITSSPSVSLSYSGTSSPMTVTGSFVGGQAYTFTMTATNANGTSGTSSASSSVTPYPLPSLASWTASTSYPYVFNIYMDARSVGPNAFVTMGGGDLNSQTKHSYRWNGSSWTSYSGNDATVFPNIAGNKETDAAQTLGGYYIQGENANPVLNPYSTTSSATSWSGAGPSIPVYTFVGGAIAWPSNVWSVTSGQSGNNTYYRTGSGSWSVGTNYPASYVGTRGHYAYSRGYTYYGATYYQTSAGGSYTLATNLTGSNPSHMKLSVVNNSLFYSDTSVGTSVYRYNSDGSSTAMTGPSGGAWTYPAMASAGSNLSLVGGRLDGSNSTGQHYTTSVS